MKRFWPAGLVIVLLGFAAFLWDARGGHTPQGQPALTDVNNAALTAMQTDFNRAINDLRVIVLLSPT
jgi:hypothetical protein